jgi:hypothetical protein
MLALIVWAVGRDLLAALRAAAVGSSGKAILTAIAAVLASAMVGGPTQLLLVRAERFARLSGCFSDGRRPVVCDDGDAQHSAPASTPAG